MNEIVLMDKETGQELVEQELPVGERKARKMDPKLLAPIDREETVICVLSHLIEPHRITVRNNRLIFWFLRSEIRPIEDKLLSNTSMMVDFHNVGRATEIWKSALTILRSRRGEGTYLDRK